MYIRNEVGELVPVSMISSGSVKSVNNIKPDKNGNVTIESMPITYGIVVKSSTPDSTKQFKITVDDSGTLTTTEVT